MRARRIQQPQGPQKIPQRGPSQIKRYVQPESPQMIRGPQPMKFKQPSAAAAPPPQPPRIVLAPTQHGFEMFLDSSEQALAPTIIATGDWEPTMRLAIERYVKPGMVCVDGGANVGFVSMLLAAKLGAARVVAVEPLDTMRALLVRSVEHNGLGSVVHVDSRALWDASGVGVELHVPGNYEGCTTISGPPVCAFVRSQRATTITLDDLLDGLGVERVHLIKLDTEGSEARIWKGMRRTWERNPELVVCAEHFSPPEGPAFLRELRASGAHVRVIDGSGGLVELVGDVAETYCMLWVTHR